MSIDVAVPTISRSRSLFSNIKITETHKINLTNNNANATKAPTLQAKLKHGRHHQSAHHLWPYSPIIKSTNMERIILIQIKMSGCPMDNTTITQQRIDTKQQARRSTPSGHDGEHLQHHAAISTYAKTSNGPCIIC